jgi:hypothetical protein
MKHTCWAVLLGVGMMAGCAFGQTGAVRKGNCDKLDAKGYCVMDAEPVTPQLCHIERSLKAITPSPDPSGWREITDLRIVCAGQAVNSEPQDVPAIQQTDVQPDLCTTCSGPGICTTVACEFPAKHAVTSWSCAEKSRVLLTDESGGKHCVKFGVSKP